ncbi:hypothetical protein [Marinobacterium litorale]|uniref:phage tail tube protein n=1 Tax=Marinobacterium litorale TaxID=404770 RepID=UPI00040DEA37|nr:hypothetical protein [Marinobacterium litorale]
MSGLLLAGDVYIDRLTDTGVSTGLVGPINVTQLALQTPSEKVQRPSKRKSTYGQTLDTVTLPQPTTINMVIDDQPADLLAMAMLGDVEQINQGSGNVSLADVTLKAGNKWTKLPHGNLADSGLALYESDGTTPIAAPAFEVNYALGMIRTTPGGAQDTGSDVSAKITYDYSAIAGTRIKAGTRSQIRMKIFMDGTNLANGLPCKLEVPEAAIAPTEAVDLFSSTYVSTTLAGDVKLVDGETAPYYFDQETA